MILASQNAKKINLGLQTLLLNGKTDINEIETCNGSHSRFMMP